MTRLDPIRGLDSVARSCARKLASVGTDLEHTRAELKGIPAERERLLQELAAREASLENQVGRLEQLLTLHRAEATLVELVDAVGGVVELGGDALAQLELIREGREALAAPAPAGFGGLVQALDAQREQLEEQAAAEAEAQAAEDARFERLKDTIRTATAPEV